MTTLFYSPYPNNNYTISITNPRCFVNIYPEPVERLTYPTKLYAKEDPISWFTIIRICDIYSSWHFPFTRLKSIIFFVRHQNLTKFTLNCREIPFSKPLCWKFARVDIIFGEALSSSRTVKPSWVCIRSKSYWPVSKIYPAKQSSNRSGISGPDRFFPATSLSSPYTWYNGNRQHKYKHYGCEPMSPLGGLDMSHFYYHGADGKRLEKHLDLAGDGSGKVDAASFCNMTQHGNVNFP